LKRFETIWKIRGVLSSLGGSALTSYGKINSLSIFLMVAVWADDYFFWSRWLGRLHFPLK